MVGLLRQFPWVAWVGRRKDENASWTCSPDAECGKPAIFLSVRFAGLCAELTNQSLSLGSALSTTASRAEADQQDFQPRLYDLALLPLRILQIIIIMQLAQTENCPPPLHFSPNERVQRCIGVVSLKEKVEKGDALSPHLLAIYQMNYATFALNHWQVIPRFIPRLYYSITFITWIL